MISSGTRCSSSRSSGGQAAAASRSARVAWVRARSPKPCTDGRVVPQAGGVAHVERVRSSWTWSTSRHEPGDQLLLVGLDPQGQGDQLGQVGRVTAVAGDERLEPSVEGVALGPVDGPGGRPSAGGGEGVVGAARGMVSTTASTRRRTTCSAASAAGSPSYARDSASRRSRSASSASSGARRHTPSPGSNFPAATKRIASSEAAASRLTDGWAPLVGAGLGQDRQSGPDRQDDRALAVGELDDAVARRVRGAQGRRPGQGHEAHRTPPPRDDCPDASPPYRCTADAGSTPVGG